MLCRTKDAFFVAELDGGQHVLVGNFSGPHFDHVHTVGVTGDQEVQIEYSIWDWVVKNTSLITKVAPSVGDDAKGFTFINADGAQGEPWNVRVGQLAGKQ